MTEIKKNLLTNEQKNRLLEIARLALEAFVLKGEIIDFAVADKRLCAQEGAFVTLHSGHNLRGCIGQITSAAPLWQTVRDMAIAAGTEDPRFAPLSADELEKLSYEISVLSRPVRCYDWRKIELGKHGVIISKNGQSGVFLPQVAAETGWDLEKFLQELCAQKAGLSPDAYKNDTSVKLEIFTAEVFN